MSNWHNVTIRFQYTAGPGNGGRSSNGVSFAVYGQSESAILDRLRKMYPQWRDFVLLEVRWTS